MTAIVLLGAALAPWVRAQSGLPPPQARSFDGWLQDFEAAKRQAASERKDIMLVFSGSE